MPLQLRIMQLGLELTDLTTPSYQIKILTGHTLWAVAWMECLYCIFQIPAPTECTKFNGVGAGI